MLKVYVDDSSVGKSLSPSWPDGRRMRRRGPALRRNGPLLVMSPKLAYYKEAEAHARQGQFAGLE